jgi:DNA helicase-2/ATP-dependent DNA helicase PcrA
MKRPLFGARTLSEQAKKLLSSAYLDRFVVERADQGNPLSLLYILRRVTSIDWNLLDIFYRLCGFEHFKKMFDVAENHGDEGPVANLGLITQYLARFLDERIAMITADLLVDKILQIVFFAYLFSLYRLGETELEDAEDPFPRGRIPFLTIHQSKGLEFPVVILGNLRKDNKGPQRNEQIVRPLLNRPQGEPLDRMAEFDIMRMYYVALSRAKNLLVLAHLKGRGQRINKEFAALLDDDFPRISQFDLKSVPETDLQDDDLPKSYSFTSDFLLYQKCPRQYIIFRKFDFVPSRSQTMFYGSLVHRTLDDLHNELIQQRRRLG